MNTLPISKFPHGEPPYQPELWNKLNPALRVTHNCYTYMLNDLYKIPRIYGKPQPGYFVNSTTRLVDPFKRLSCSEVKKGVKADNPHIEQYSLARGRKLRCPPNYYKGFMIVSPGNDYHFARQDNRMITVYRAIHRDIHLKKTKLVPDPSILIQMFLAYSQKHIPEIVELSKQLKSLMKDDKSRLRHIVKCSKVWSHKPGGTDATDKDADGKLIVDPEKANWDYRKKGGINYKINCCYFSIPSNNIAHTYSSGIPFVKKDKKKNNPHDVRKNLSVDKKIDSKYEKLLKTICK